MKKLYSSGYSIYAFIALIVNFLTCCEINKNKSQNGLSNYSVNIQSLEPKYYPENLVKSVRYLKLETNHKNLIKGIDKIRFLDENIFILDRKTNSVYVFDTNGRYKNKFFHYGSGPGEYINLTDFDVTRDNRYILMLDMNQGKLVIYNMEDTLIKEIKLEFKTHSFSYVQDNVLVFYQMNRQNDLKKFQNNLVLWDFEKEEFIKGFLPITNPNFLYGSWESLYVSGDDVYFCPNLTTTVYKINSSDIESFFTFNSGNSQLPEEFFKSTPYYEVPAKLIESRYNCSYGQFYATDDFVTFSFANNRHSYTVFYSTESKKFVYGCGFGLFNSKRIPGRLLFKGLYDDELVSYFFPSDVMIKPHTLLPSYYKDTIRNRELIDIANITELDDNPILTFVRVNI